MSIIKVDAGKLRNGAYRREMKRNWWMQLPFYSLYMLREATAIFTLFYTLVLMVGLAALAKGQEAFVKWTESQSCGFMMWLSVISFVMVLYHTVTWFAATPKVMPLQIGDKKVPASLLIAGHWLAFFFMMIIILALAGLQ
ncbi:MAG: fumarate reductase subunit C [Gammaproteobacteria bacterium]|nr:MAG: fumarate reductase subunit C [Gammaproteobacteria bacterium]